MQLSIRWWTILAVNAVVIGVSIAQGWVAQGVAGQVVEERIAHEMAGSVSHFFAGRSLPLSDTMMGYLRDILNEDWIAVRGGEQEIIGSSLPESLTTEFRKRIGLLNQNGIMVLSGREYRIQSHNVASQLSADENSETRLYVLMDTNRLHEARSLASRRVAATLIPSTLGATALAFFLALGITQPVRRVAREMDRLASVEPGNVGSESDGRASLSTPTAQTAMASRRLSQGPTEVRQLTASFYGLLDRLQQAQQRLISNDRLATLGRVCLSVGHELRNPLSGIKMNMRVIQDQMANDDQGVEAILREIDRMELYLDELMSLGAGSQQTTKPDGKAVRLSALCDSVLTILTGRLRHGHITVQTDYPPDEPVVIADSNQLRQAIMNFVINAIEAMPTGGPLELSIRRNESMMHLCVKDCGKGVEQGFDRLFEAFSTNKPNGVGLGLYLSKQIVEHHGGKIGFRNERTGASFWFEIPLVQTAIPNESALKEVEI